MIARVIKYLIDHEDEVTTQWLEYGEPPISTIGLALHKDGLHHTYKTKEGSDTRIINDRAIVKSLIEFKDPVISVALLWKLCRFFDENYRLDAQLRALVERDTNLKLEKTPFILEGTDAVNKMDKSVYTERYKKAEYANIIVDNNTLVLRLSLVSTSVTRVLIQHLRRVAWQTN